MTNRVPPQAIEIEKAVLGAVLIEKDAFNLASEMIRPEMFYITKHQEVFTAMERISQRGGAIDFLTVLDELKDKSLAALLTSFTNTVV
jgi:replicative DNA helicase